ncbi:MAG: hypothetical protein ACKVP0_12490 [Pirellulaceae bacterium]
MSESWPDPPSDPQPNLTPEQRRDEFAAILVLGVLRFLRQEAAHAPAKILEFSAAHLEVPVQTRLSVSRRTGG